jgi:hypothetical protein
VRQLRQNILVRFLCVLVAAILFNVSVDAPDLHGNSVPEDLSYNDIESVVEWVAEEVCDIEDAIPEHDDTDQNSPFKLGKKFEFFYHIQLAGATPSSVGLFFESLRNFSNPNFHSQTAHDELIQPPEA